MKICFSISLSGAAVLAAFSCLVICDSALGGAEDEGNKRIEAAFSRVQSIAETVEEIRGLEFTNRIDVAIQSMPGLKSYVEKELQDQFEDQDPQHYVAALVKLGALKESLDFNEWIYGFLKDQAAAHYAPGEKTYYLVQTNLNSMMLDVITSHELCHALQDHNFDLERLTKGDPQMIRDNGDLLLARQSLFEGEATWVMTAWMFMDQLGGKSLAAVDPMVSMAVKAQAAMDFDSLVKLSGQSAGGLDSGGEMLSMPEVDLEGHPRFFVQQILGVYIQGALMIDHVKSQGGWDAVSALYRDNPIESTEQVLHPEKLFGETRESPVAVRIMGLEQSLPQGWNLVEQDVLGEMSMVFLFELWKDGEEGGVDAASVAKGWGGDRYYYFLNEASGEDMLVWKTVWDSEREASEFAAGYRMMLARRFPDLKPVRRAKGKSGFSSQVWEVEKGRFLKLARSDKVVGIVDAGHRKLLRLIWE